jgi:hypothetical protein
MLMKQKNSYRNSQTLVLGIVMLEQIQDSTYRHHGCTIHDSTEPEFSLFFLRSFTRGPKTIES